MKDYISNEIDNLFLLRYYQAYGIGIVLCPQRFFQRKRAMKETRQATVVSQRCLGCGIGIPRSKEVHFCRICNAKRGSDSGIRVVGKVNGHHRIIKKLGAI